MWELKRLAVFFIKPGVSKVLRIDSLASGKALVVIAPPEGTLAV